MRTWELVYVPSARVLWKEGYCQTRFVEDGLLNSIMKEQKLVHHSFDTHAFDVRFETIDLYVSLQELRRLKLMLNQFPEI